MTPLPFFFHSAAVSENSLVELDGDTSRHITGVLRMKTGDALHLTDGQGHLLTVEIAEEYKKKCNVLVKTIQYIEPPVRKITVAISLLKNKHRFEWFLEKATEIGITEIIPLITERTERQHFRPDRMKNVLVSAMLQSQQVWLPVLQEPVAFDEVIDGFAQQQKFIAHCIETDKKSLAQLADAGTASQVILIGPEGDFSPVEIQTALDKGFVPVTLGDTRLRTETAAVVAAALLRIA